MRLAPLIMCLQSSFSLTYCLSILFPENKTAQVEQIKKKKSLWSGHSDADHCVIVFTLSYYWPLMHLLPEDGLGSYMWAHVRSIRLRYPVDRHRGDDDTEQ